MANGLGARSSILTDVGRARQVNEDWCGYLEPRDGQERERDGWLWIVADGVGAYGTGEEASQAAGRTAIGAYRRTPQLDPQARLREAVVAANRAVWERRRHYVRLGQSRPVMTTFLAAALVRNRAVLANVGDCRAYLIHDGRLTQLTRDHTWVGEQVARGLLSPEDARHHRRGHVITRSLGQFDTVEVDLYEQPLSPGDRLVLCSDGLTRHLDDREILRMAASDPPERAVRAMLDLANSRGGEDNITVGVIELLPGPSPTPPRGVQPLGSARQLAAPPPAPSLKIDDLAPRRAVERHPTPEPTEAAQTFSPTHAAAPDRPSPRKPVPARPAPPALPPAVAANRDHLATLLAIGQRISASLDLTETLQSVMDSVVEVTGGERGFIMLWDEATAELVYSIGRNVSPSGNDAPEFSRNIVQSVFQNGQPIRIGDAMADARFNQFESVVMQSLRSVLCAPLQVGGRPIGVVYVDNRFGSEVFTEIDLELLSAFAGQAAVALANARLHEQLKAQVAENALMRSNQENVLRSISSGIISLDADGRVITFNRMAEEILGVRAASAQQRSLRELLPTGLQRTIGALLDEADEQAGGPDRMQIETSLPHRGRSVLAIQALPLADAEHRRVGSMLVVDDITQERVLDEARQREESEKNRVKALFGRYVPPSVFDELMANPETVQLGGTRREVTVMFADIRGFTGLAERSTPEEVVKLLNSYLACATEVIHANGGTLDKFLGDGVMAFFNAPLPREDHVLAAVRAAMQMQTRLRALQGPTGNRIAFGVGINTGEAIVGNIGTPELMNYTIIGDVVNVAARLQGEARAGEVLLSSNVYEQVASLVEVEELGSMHVKGRAQPVPIFKAIRVFE